MTGSLRAPAGIVLISTYELGRQPLSLASPCAVLQRAGFSPAALDMAVDRLETRHLDGARLVAIAVPMHTALRLGVRALQRARSIAPRCRIALYGLYATLNAAALFSQGADFVIGGECEEPLLRSEEHTSELQSLRHLVCRLLLEKKKKKDNQQKNKIKRHKKTSMNRSTAKRKE